MMLDADAVFAAAIARAGTAASCASGAQKSGAATSRPRNACRHHADDLERRAADEHGPSEHVRIAIEVAGPALVAQHDRPDCRLTLVVGGASARPITGSTPTTWKKLPVTSDDRHHPAVDAQIDVGHRRIGVGEDAGLPCATPRTRARERRSIAIGQPRPFDGVHLGRCRGPRRRGTGTCSGW